MDGKWEKQEVKSISSKQAQARQTTPKGWVTIGKCLQEPAKALMFREVRHLMLPLCYIIWNDNMLQARRSLETAAFHSGSFPQ